MIIAVDTETVGLNAQEFVLGSIVIQGKENSPETYTNKKEMWERILELGKYCKKYGKLLTVLAHNHQYDLYAYADLTTKDLQIDLDNPLIARIKNNTYNIKFLDTYAIYRMSLEKAGKLIDMEKKEMPIELQMTRDFITKEAIEKIKPYCIQDSLICLKLYEKALEIGKKHMKLNYIYTIYQMGISIVVKELCKNPKTDTLFYNQKIGVTRKTNHSEFIRGAYRGGRVEAFNTGKNIRNLYQIDNNSLYPHSLENIELPNLKTERSIQKPLEYINKEELFNKIGFSRCLIYNNSNKLPYLPIRGENESIYPQKGQYFIGTYTHLELKEAINRGYNIITVEKSVIYDKSENHFKKVMKTLYELRKSGGKLENYFYKQFMNGSIGKFAQIHHDTPIIIDHHTNTKKRLIQGYEIINNYMESLLFKEPKKDLKFKRYYAPQISALTTAYARTLMQKAYEKIPQEDLYYTDTDSIIFKGNHLEKFNISNNLGDFKIEQNNEEGSILGKKMYKIGPNIKFSGVRKSDITEAEFENGEITYKKIVGIKSAHSIKEVGTFRERCINIDEQIEKKKKILREYSEEWLLIDSDIKNITYFLPYLESREKLNKKYSYRYSI